MTGKCKVLVSDPLSNGGSTHPGWGVESPGSDQVVIRSILSFFSVSKTLR